MRPHVLNRRIHYWLGALSALPVLVIVSTGLLLQLKKNLPWVQPVEHTGSKTTRTVSLDQLLKAAQMEPGQATTTWSSVERIDIRPRKGLAKVLLEDKTEIQVDLGTGQVLARAYRRSDLIEALHDGSFFAGDGSKLGVFLPAGLALLVLWISGIWLFVLPYWIRYRIRRGKQPQKAK